MTNDVGFTLVLVTLCRGSQMILSKTTIIGDTKYKYHGECSFGLLMGVKEGHHKLHGLISVPWLICEVPYVKDRGGAMNGENQQLGPLYT